MMTAAAALLYAPVAANPFYGSAHAPEINPVRISRPDSSSVERQTALRARLALYFRAYTESGSVSVLITILLTAFAYGIFHAAGPGHRKTVVFSLYLTRKARLWEPLAAGFFLAVIHGLTSVILLFIFRGASGAITARADSAAVYMEGAAYLFLAAAAAVLLSLALRNAYIAEKYPVENRTSGMGLGAVLISGIYPCPGAVLVLVLSLTLGSIGIGIMSVLAMSLGMAIPITAAGYLAWFGRTGLFTALKHNEAGIKRAAMIIEIIGYTILLVFAVYMVMPFLVSAVRYVF